MLAVLLAVSRPSTGELVQRGAKAQLVHPADYTQEYFELKYPMGDPPADRGACTDVVVRALRVAGIDLQEAIHRDAQARPYPGIARLDPNIDHRRCPNQKVWFSRHARSLPLDREFRPGDIVYWKLEGGLDHTGVVSNTRGESGAPMVIHNINRTAEQDVLFAWTVVGHFRLR